MIRALTATVLVAAGTLVASTASAHTEADLVAVPAGSGSTVTLKPTHGCGESPTVEVRIRAPMEGAVAEPIDGWTASATSDGAGNTVLEWTGGPLPADAEGAFPVSFTAPDEPGRLLTFPAIQVCADGQELAWISGDPLSEFPAPRVLVLPAGFAPAATIDEVPLDAPGRAQLVEVVDVDNPQATTTTTAGAPTTTAPSTTTSSPTTVASTITAAVVTTTSSAVTSTSTTETPTSEASSSTGAPGGAGGDQGGGGGGGGGGGAATWVGAAIAVAAVGGTTVFLLRRRSTASPA